MRDNLIFGITKKDFLIYGLQVIGIFITTFLVLFAFGITPSSIKKTISEPLEPEDFQTGTVTYQRQNRSDRNIEPQTVTVPTRVIIDKIGVDSIIQHPQTVDVETLDKALTKGAVYYPGSGTIEQGNVFLFGHSSNWQIVRNQA